MRNLRPTLSRVIFLIAVGSAVLSESRAETQNVPHYTLVRTFGVGLERSEDGGYPITAYLPPRTLLFNIDHEKPDLTVGTIYSYAVTQDGVPIALINPDNRPVISRGPLVCSNTSPFPDCGADLLVFHADHDLCRDKSCSGIGNLLSVNPGDVAEIVDYDDTFVELAINRGELIAAFLSHEQLSNAESEAVVTRVKLSDAALNHPHFVAEVTRSSLTSTACGELPRSSRSERPVSRVDELIIDALDLGNVDRSNATREGYAVVSFDGLGREFEPASQDSEESGQIGEKWEHRYYYFSSQREDFPDRAFVAQIVYRCNKTGSVSQTDFVKYVNLVEIDDDGVANRTKLNHWMTLNGEYDLDEYRVKLRSETRDPYLWSVNTPEQYFDLIKRISVAFENRALAGYFYSEFNRSCRSQTRSSRLCTDYELGKDIVF